MKELVRQVIDERTRAGELMEGRLGTIDPAYSTGAPKVIFDGEDAVSGRTYMRLASYTPVAGDRVELLRFGSTWVIQGKVV